jgi:hypothetical protein
MRLMMPENITDNIGEHMAKEEEELTAKAVSDLRGVIQPQVNKLKDIIDKQRYRRWTTKPWDRGTSREVRLRLRTDADWRAVQRVLPGQIEGSVIPAMTKALQFGALETAEHVCNTLDEQKGVECDWDLSREALVEVGKTMVNGFTHKEHAQQITNDLFSKLDAALRTSARHQGTMVAVRSEFSKRADDAVRAALSSLSRLVGDAVADGQRFAMQLFEHPRTSIG